MAKADSAFALVKTDTSNLPAHDDYGGSSCYRWLNCTLAIPLSKTLPKRPTNSAAERGTALHAAMEILTAVDCKLKPADFLNAVAPNGVRIEEDGVRDLAIALEDVKVLEKKYPRNKFTWVFEARIRYEDNVGGSSDILIYSSKAMVIADYKFGQHEVDIEDNEQMRLYAIAARKQFGLRPEMIATYVIQPAFDPSMVSKTLTAAELDTFEASVKMALKASRTSPTANPGEWCAYAACALTCPAKTKPLVTLTRGDVHKLDLAKLGEQALLAREIAKWGEEAEARIFHEMENGVTIPGWKLVNKQARRNWIDEKAALKAMAKIVPKAADAFMALISPAQVEKINKSAPLKAVIDKHTQSVSSGLTAAPESDRRPAALNIKLLDKAKQALIK